MIVRRLLVALGPLVVFIVLAELTVRIIQPDLSIPGRTGRFRFAQDVAAVRPEHVRDSRLGWRLRPGQSGTMTTNSRGFRTPEFADRKSPGTVRMLFFGDSNPLGFGLDDDTANYPHRVEQILNDVVPDSLGLRFESINLGVDGYSSYQTRLLVDDYVPRLHPDLAAIQVGFNDYCLAPVRDADHDFSRPVLLDLLEASHAYRWFRRVVLSVAGTPTSAQDPVRRVSPEEFEANLVTMVRRIRESGAVPVLLTTPVRPAVPLVINEERIVEDGQVSWVTQNEWITDRLRAAGIDPPNSPLDPRYIPVVERAMVQHPDWALFPFMLATAHRLQGRPEVARDYEAAWRAEDRERAVFGRYMQALESVARQEGALVVDVPAALDAYLGEAGEKAPSDLFIDFVHLDGPGNVVVATEISRLVVDLIEQRLARQ